MNQKDTAKMAVPYLGADGAAPSKMFRCNRARTEYALRIVTTMGKTKVAVVGASGYAGEELMRLLWAHPKVVLVAVTSRQYSGETVADIFPRSSHDETARALKSAPELDVHIDLHSGRGEFVLYASDLTENYVAFNKGGVNDPTTLGG